ncbi:hypothetical protein A3G56_03340 [Candidatus Falkowbacteria bacterium RIFCSPLOWO2_12_FULL_45_10]|uniref:Transcription regulator TrmB N-terminal domain-containing protein n=1 Tax=Candidatus Falkowbacteria bacterium RIFCSPLOWO2_12_FULL_45_10 TaxID=1797990 RepID=A0A1F5RZQ0_9BACT|nr:MAG: hypothetical protein A3G56_03340 [Candidatus Falkowbacteria bacterium RIFCSPLOWO2_12_FULL_45_10]
MISAKELEQFGLSDKEAKVYLAALQLGRASVQNIAQKADIHRVSVYDILEKLARQGLISQTIQGKKRLFVATKPEKIQADLENKREVFSKLLPELKALENVSRQKPKVTYFEGREEFWQAYFDRIRHESELKENLVYGSSEKILGAYPEEYKKFTKERMVKGIKVKLIVEQSSFGREEKRKGEEELREVKFLPTDMKLKTGTIVYGDRVMIVSWGSLSVVIIEDADYAANQKTVFNLLWGSLTS